MEYLTGLESLYLNAASATVTTTEDVDSHIKQAIDEKDNLIRRQLKEIMDLKRELDVVVNERDSLLCEVNKLKFELEVAGLKKVRDELRRSSQEDLAMTSPQINGDPTNSTDGSPLKLDKPPCGPGPPPNINSGECMGNCGTCKQGMFKKPGSVRNGDVIKRSRVQTGYELSQDLLDKQIEMLERKYGGVRARTAALTIQRAFRRYTLLKKFAAITAMAKAEKRLSRRFQMGGEACAPSEWHHRQMRNAIYKDLQDPCDQNQVPGGGEASARRMAGEPSDWHHRQLRHAIYKDLQDTCEQNQLSQVPGGPVEEPCAASEWYHRQMRNAIYKDLQDPCDQNQQNLVEPVTQRPHQRPPRPVRSLSMRERRSTSQIGRGGEESSHGVGPPMRGPSPHPLTGTPSQSLPRSQSAGVSAANTRSLDAEGGDLSDTPSYSQFEEACECFTNGGPMHCTNYNKHIWFHLNMSPYCDTTHDYAAKEEYLEDRRSGQPVGHSRDSSLGRGMATSPPPSSGQSEPGSGGTRSSQREGRRVPPEVPKRTSSISMRSVEGRRMQSSGSGLAPQRGSRGPCPANLTKSAENGSLSSVQSSGSDSSGLSTDRTTYESSEGDNQSSPIWKRKVQSSSPEHHSNGSAGLTPVTSSNIPCQHRAMAMTPAHSRTDDRQASPNLQANVSHLPDPSPTTPTNNHVTPHESPHPIYKVSDTVRKRQYRVGLNLFNKKPERGVTYLIRRGFLESTPQGVAKFLISRKGLSKQMIGEYLGNLQNPFNMAVLDAFSQELDLSGMQVDVALRKFQTYFRMPGEAQKIERLMEIYGQRYCQCNRDVVARFKDPETVFVLAFAIIMLNTDLHTPNLKPDRRMKLEDFIRNLRGIDDGNDIDRDMLIGIYERVKASEFKPSSDHVTQVMKVQSTMIGKKPNLALPHRRLVCYCRLYEIPDIYKKERPGVHQREVFLFNDLLVITKLLSKKKSSVGYVFRQSFPLCGMVVTLFEVPYYSYGIRLTQRVDGKVLVTFNARNEHDRYKFAEDLRESISEMDEMESLRIEAELERQKSGRGGRGAAAENRDSGVADIEEASPREGAGCSLAGEFSSGKHTTRSLDKGSGSDRMEVREDEMAPAVSSGCVVMRSDGARNRERPNTDGALKRSALSNSLLDIHDQFAGEKPQRRGSVGSLDSGMSISFQSTSASTVSRDSSPQQTTAANKGSNCPKSVSYQQSFLGGLFGKRERKSSRSEEGGCGMLGGTSPVGRSTEV